MGFLLLGDWRALSEELKVDTGRAQVVLHLERLTMSSALAANERGGLVRGPVKPRPFRGGVESACIQLEGKVCEIGFRIPRLPAKERSRERRQLHGKRRRDEQFLLQQASDKGMAREPFGLIE